MIVFYGNSVYDYLIQQLHMKPMPDWGHDPKRHLVKRLIILDMKRVESKMTLPFLFCFQAYLEIESNQVYPLTMT
jgi:hypothetical protein